MVKVSGINTRTIGEKLKRQVNADKSRYAGIKIFYDHGNSSQPEICQPTTYIIIIIWEVSLNSDYYSDGKERSFYGLK